MSLVGSQVLNVFMRGKARAAGGGMHGSGETGDGLKKERKIRIHEHLIGLVDALSIKKDMHNLSLLFFWIRGSPWFGNCSYF
jgi:hypothetical protein